MGIAVNELVKFNESVQEQTLKELEEITKISQAELSKRFATQKESFLEDIGMSGIANLLGFDISDLQKTKIATDQALDTFKKDPASFDATEQQSILKALDGIFLASEADFDSILNDQSKTKAILNTVNAARQLAIQGAFGQEESKKLLEKLLMFSSNLQVQAQRVVREDKPRTFITDRLAGGEGDLLELFGTEFLKDKKFVDESMSIIEKNRAEIMRLKNLKDKGETTDEENTKMGQLIFDTRNLEAEVRRANVRMSNFSAFGLYSEGALGFDANNLTKMFSDVELENLIKVALKNELFKMVNQDINEAAAVSDRQPPLDIKTGVTSTTQNVKQGDTIVGNSDNEIDKHIKD